ncbi:MAG: hypothetical protein CFE24_13180 [Flavobacterium sp. BFFFF2]|nr:MAG: hypothetical protein CFE24_13180 [Flavobacterium sp. BFFFF2]
MSQFQNLLDEMDFSPKLLTENEKKVIECECERYYSTFNIDKSENVIERRLKFLDLISKNIESLNLYNREDYYKYLNSVTEFYSFKIEN